jgi:hypothetical protein
MWLDSALLPASSICNIKWNGGIIDLSSHVTIGPMGGSRPGNETASRIVCWCLGPGVSDISRLRINTVDEAYLQPTEIQ